MTGEMDIVKKAELEAVEQLKDSGWKIARWDPDAESAKDIEAVSGPDKLLVKVQAAQAPNDPPHMSEPEMENMRVRAMKEEAKPYQARVKLDQNLNRLGNIGWMRLN